MNHFNATLAIGNMFYWSTVLPNHKCLETPTMNLWTTAGPCAEHRMTSKKVRTATMMLGQPSKIVWGQAVTCCCQCENCEPIGIQPWHILRVHQWMMITMYTFVFLKADLHPINGKVSREQWVFQKDKCVQCGYPTFRQFTIFVFCGQCGIDMLISW